MFLEHIQKVLDGLKKEHVAEQRRGAVSSSVVFREFASGKVLLMEDWTFELINEHASSKGVAGIIDDIDAAIRNQHDSAFNGLSAALVRNRTEHESFIVLVYVQR